jgi:hypothetical protein
MKHLESVASFQDKHIRLNVAYLEFGGICRNKVGFALLDLKEAAQIMSGLLF